MTLSASDLRTLAWSDVIDPLPKEQVYLAFQTPPFIPVPGTFNTRDIGLIPVGVPGIRPGYVFRSGALSALTEDGKKVLSSLGIKKIFDLRSVDEHSREPDPEIEGVEVVWTKPKEELAIVDLGLFVDGEGEKGYKGMYMSVLDEYKANVRQVLEHVRDCPEEAFLIHCTAGRDRTGVVAGILMSLAGGDSEAVIFDFMLSRIGTEPAREKLLAFAMKGSGANTIDAPGFRNMCSLKPAGWAAFVQAAEEKYGGFEGYVTKTLGVSKEELVTIKTNLGVLN